VGIGHVEIVEQVGVEIDNLANAKEVGIPKSGKITEISKAGMTIAEGQTIVSTVMIGKVEATTIATVITAIAKPEAITITIVITVTTVKEASITTELKEGKHMKTIEITNKETREVSMATTISTTTEKNTTIRETI
jgi:hypothetical protein